MHRRGAVTVTVKSCFFVFLLLLLLLHVPQSVFGFATSKRTSGKKRVSDQHQQQSRGFGKPTVPSWQQVADKCSKTNPPSLLDACPCGGGVGATTTSGIDDNNNSNNNNNSNKNNNNNIKSYGDCCAPYHRGDAYPESPRLLLQSRYSAFVIRDIRYIIETTHPTNSDWREDKVAWVKELDRNMFDNHDFVSLHAGTEQEVRSETEEYITFTVRLRGKEGSEFFDTKQDRIIRERSKFLKDSDGRWLYASGELSILQE